MEFHAAICPYGNDLKMVSLDFFGRVTESWKGCVSASWRRVLGSVGGALCGGSRLASVGRRGPLISLWSRQRLLTLRRRARLSTLTPGPIRERTRIWILSRRERW